MSFKLFVSIGELSLSKRLQELAEGSPWENVTFGLTSNMVPGVNSISDRNLSTDSGAGNWIWSKCHEGKNCSTKFQRYSRDD